MLHETAAIIGDVQIRNRGTIGKASRYATGGAAPVATVDPNSVCQQATVGLNGITENLIAAVGVEEALVGKSLTEQSIQTAAAKAADDLDPLGDIFASVVYRPCLSRVMTKRALSNASHRV